RTVDTVLFDKTGTLTKGEPVVGEVSVIDGANADEVLALAAAAESDSEHPLAKAIVRAANDKHLRVPTSVDFMSSPAVGVTATVEGTTVRVGGPHLLTEEDAEELPAVDQWRTDGAIILHVIQDGQVIGALKLADEVRSESREAVDALHARGVQ